jgi:tape measure domain-containing protein
MDELAKLTIRVDSRDAASATTNLSGLTKQVGATEGAAGRLTSAATRVGVALTGIGVAAGAAVAALKPIVDAGDQYTKLANRLSAASNGGDMVRTQQQLFQLAQQTGQSYESIVSSFARASLSAKTLNATQAEMVTLTGTVSKALQVSGASAGEAASASQQLAQALSSGVLAGDELKAILENAPVLAQQIAAGLGVGVGELRQMGREGQLLSKDVFAAILKQSAEIDAQFAKMSGTVEQSSQRVSDAWTRVLAGLDEKIGASRYLKTFLDATARTLSGEGSVLGGTAGAGGGAAFTAGFVPGAQPERFINRVQEGAAMRNPLFRGAVSPINTLPAGMTLDGINTASQYDLRRSLGLPTIEFGRGEAKDDGGLAKMYAAAEKVATEAASGTQRMLDELTQAGRDLVTGIQRRFDEMGALMDALSNTTVRQNRYEQMQRIGAVGVSGPSGAALVATDRAPSVAAQDRAEAAMVDAARRAQATTQALADGLQRSIAQGIAGGFTDGARSLQAFADNMKRTLINALSEGLANKFVGGLMGNGGGAGGLLGGLFGGKAAGAAGAGAGAGSLAGLGLFGLGVAGVASLFGPRDNPGDRLSNKWASGPLSASPFAAPMADAPFIAGGTYGGPAGFNAGAYRFDAGRPASGTAVTGNTITITLPEGSTAAMAQQLLIELERLARAQGRPAGTLPLSRA